MRIATFNVNGVNARLAALLRWLEESEPDVACLQELKMPAERFPADALRATGYAALWHGQKSWNGVAILSRGSAPVERRRVLPGDAEDLNSRYIEAVVGDIVVCCLYLPNGNPAPGPRFDYKLRWLDRLLRHASELLREQRPVVVACLYLPNGNPAPGPRFDYKLRWLDRLIRHAATLLAEQRDTVLAGDFNIIPTDLDVYAPERWLDDALFRPEVRSAYQSLLEQGWVDALRKLHPDERVYTFWKYLRNAFMRDAGLRIDHLLLSPRLAQRLVAGGVDREVRGWDKPSDHAPVWVEIA